MYVDLHSTDAITAGGIIPVVCPVGNLHSVQLVAAEMSLPAGEVPLPKTDHIIVSISAAPSFSVNINNQMSSLGIEFAGKLVWNAEQELYRLQFVPAAVLAAPSAWPGGGVSARSFKVSLKRRNGQPVAFEAWSVTLQLTPQLQPQVVC